MSGPLGFWLLVDDHEYFVLFKDYPAFTCATIAQIFDIQKLAPGQFYWPALDVDMELDALEHPEQYPLEWKD